MRNKIVFMVGGTETLEYFSRELAKAFQLWGYQIFLFDLTDEEKSSEKLAHFAGYSDTVLITFNFDGLHMETALYNGEGQLFWELRDIPCINITVDHPFYAPELLAIHPKNYYHVSIDRYHLKYIETFYPDITNNLFLPLAGTSLFPNGDYLPVSRRKYDIVFPGNYTPKEDFDKYINRLGKDYAQFYRSILQELIDCPDTPDDVLMERRLREEFPDASNGEICEAIANMIFIDTYIHSYYRAKAVQILVDHGIRVHCLGMGWNRLACRHPENLSYEEGLFSHECLQRMADAKLSLNVMPWFKDGAHDRVFNAMANGSVSLSDHSKYLDECFQDGENIAFYDLNHMDSLPELTASLLANPDKLQYIADAGYTETLKKHTWLHRAESLNQLIACIQNHDRV